AGPQQRLGDVTHAQTCQIREILWWALPQPSYKAVGLSERISPGQPSPCFLPPRWLSYTSPIQSFAP
ncbi:hypothetical protein Tco_0463978, partial [Tanacetum coccineum]